MEAFDKGKAEWPPQQEDSQVCVCSATTQAKRCVETAVVRLGIDADKAAVGVSTDTVATWEKTVCLFNSCGLHSRHVLGTILCLEIHLRIKSSLLLPCGAYLLGRKCNCHKPKLGSLNRPVRKEDP